MLNIDPDPGLPGQDDKLSSIIIQYPLFSLLKLRSKVKYFRKMAAIALPFYF
jgi:hypothetical protein